MSDCGICGIDPVKYEAVPMGLTAMDLCEECMGHYNGKVRQATLDEVREKIQVLRPEGSGWSTIGRTIDKIEAAIDAMKKEGGRDRLDPRGSIG